MPDDQDRAEQLDDDVVGDEWPPDPGPTDPVEVELLDQGPDDEEKDLVAEEGEEDEGEGPGVGAPRFDTAADRAPPPAEEAAVHVVDEDDL